LTNILNYEINPINYKPNMKEDISND